MAEAEDNVPAVAVPHDEISDTGPAAKSVETAAAPTLAADEAAAASGGGLWTSVRALGADWKAQATSNSAKMAADLQKAKDEWVAHTEESIVDFKEQTLRNNVKAIKDVEALKSHLGELTAHHTGQLTEHAKVAAENVKAVKIQTLAEAAVLQEKAKVFQRGEYQVGEYQRRPSVATAAPAAKAAAKAATAAAAAPEAAEAGSEDGATVTVTLEATVESKDEAASPPTAEGAAPAKGQAGEASAAAPTLAADEAAAAPGVISAAGGGLWASVRAVVADWREQAAANKAKLDEEWSFVKAEWGVGAKVGVISVQAQAAKALATATADAAALDGELRALVAKQAEVAAERAAEAAARAADVKARTVAEVAVLQEKAKVFQRGEYQVGEYPMDYPATFGSGPRAVTSAAYAAAAEFGTTAESGAGAAVGAVAGVASASSVPLAAVPAGDGLSDDEADLDVAAGEPAAWAGQGGATTTTITMTTTTMTTTKAAAPSD